MNDAVIDKWKERAAKADENRRAMPGVTSIVDELRQHFPECRVTYAAEAGHEIGKPFGGYAVSAALQPKKITVRRS